MSHSRPNQCERIIQYIKDFGSITTLEAFTELGGGKTWGKNKRTPQKRR
jgi:hypothetical protein